MSQCDSGNVFQLENQSVVIATIMVTFQIYG